MKSPRRITPCAVCPVLFCALLFCGLFAPTLTAEEEVLQEWTFASSDSAAGWSGGNITQPTVVDGALTATFRASDPILISPIFDIKPAVGQYVEITARCVSAQAGELFYAADTSGIYGGFSQEKSTRWELINDGRTHTYKIYPQWAGLPQIIRIRIDFGAPTGDQIGKEGFALESVRIVDPHFDQLPECDGVWDFTDNCDWSAGSSVEKTPAGWRLTGNDEASVIASPLFRFRTGKERPWLNLTLKGTAPRIQIGYATDISRSWASIGFDLTPSDEPIVYNIRLGDKNNWGSELVLLSLKLTRAGEATVERVQVSDSPQGPPRLEVCSALATEAINRCGTPTPIAVSIKNVGGEPAGDVRVQLTPPDGITAEGEALLGDALPFEPLEGTFLLTCDHPFSGTIPYTVTAKDLPPISGSIDVEITEPLGLEKAEYVPQPRPIELEDPELEIGALYFPGWDKRSSWQRIWSSQPIRKPVLGWYQEGLPEVVDWQIKWALESGISFFLVDWYWNRGHRSLEHWVQAFQQARYKSQFKWAMMWANHNGPGSHSIEDQRAVTQYWLDNYFNTPEYYTIDGKPVVMIWSPEGMDNDIRKIEREKGNDLPKGQGVKTLLEESRRMAVEAGYPGIYFIAMKWPEASTDPACIQWLKDAGFDCTSIYHYMSPGPNQPVDYTFDFDKVVDSSLPWWEKRLQTGILPFLPNLTSGWDDRPWNNHLVIANRTVKKFRKVCEEMKAYLAKSGQKRIVIAPVNEWGEGSYIEPNREFGFGMYEALRQTFGKQPEGGWPLFYGPSDVGLGPYDYPEEE
ncbi:MAG: glycoside hydrolase family 99-like domain-containing protein [Thermoguttaceae bacterium]|nr:glycoside hydrolase family 99-like domain-containing protein [Thermoguttaceae bacterium]